MPLPCTLTLPIPHMLEVTTDIGENTVAWGSSDETVATVDADGLVTPLKIGETTITANVGGTTATCTVSVVDGPVTKLELDKEGLELFTGDTGELSIFALEADVEQTSAPVWSSDNTEVATVDQEGNVTAVGAGQATITVTVDNASASSAIVVNPNIYIAGSEINEDNITVAKVWKNGEVLYALSDGISSNSFANDIFVDGDDVYVAGWEQSLNQISTATAKVWKNGVPTTLSAPAKAESIFVSDGTVYVAGTTDNNGKAVVWTDGTMELLPTENEEVTINSIFIEDNKVYVVGSDFTNDGLRAKQWVDGEVTYLSQTESEAKSVFVSDGTVYVVGIEGNYPNNKATVWVNGDKVSGAAPSYATDVFVENEDVYTSLSFNGDSQVYKNGGLLYTLPELNGETSTTESIFVVNNMVYSTGYFSDPYNNPGIPYWINNELFVIEKSEGMKGSYGSAIFVK